MTRWSMAAASVLILVVAVSADDAKASGKPVGKWKRTAGDNSVTFEIKDDGLQGTVVAGGNTIEIMADYGVTKDGVLFGRVRNVTKKGTEEGPSEGELFSFKFVIDKNTMTLSELKTSGPGEGGDAKALVEGEYQKEK